MKEYLGVKLGVVGAGRIAPHHLRAAIESGFTLDSICARDFSKNAQAIGLEFGFANICNTFEDFMNQEVDGYLVLTGTDSLAPIARKLLTKTKPILIEKPVSSSVDEIKSLRESDKLNRIVVGYNRRNLSSVRLLKFRLATSPVMAFQLIVPELSSTPNPTKNDIEYMITENSVHAFDLAFFIFGQPSSWTIHSLDYEKNVFARRIDLIYGDNCLGSILVTIGVADNWSLSVYTPGNRFLLSPLEKYKHYDRMEFTAPSLDRPNKSYFPKESKVWSPTKEDTAFKAGFISQINDFGKFIVSGKRPETLASLGDAEFVLAFARSLLSSNQTITSELMNLPPKSLWNNIKLNQAIRQQFTQRPTPYVASLRIYEPLTSFSPVDQLRWSSIPIESFTGREEQDRALRRVILAEPHLQS